MTQSEDPRLAATRHQAMEAALTLLREDGVLAVTHAAVSKATGISRSTLYRHWPTVGPLRNDAFKRAARSTSPTPKTNGPLRTDLIWLLSFLVRALNDTPWGQIAPQVIAAAATDVEARAVIHQFMAERISGVEAVFEAAHARGELRPDAPIRQLVELAISTPYFRKLIADLPLDQAWLEQHVDLICRLATAAPETPDDSARAPDHPIG